MALTRRDFLAGTTAGVAALSIPAPALAADTRRILVVVQLAGGNDGLNTLAPISDPRYRTLRPTVALGPNEVLSLRATPLALNAAMGALHALFEKGQLAIVQGVGTPMVNRSHFESTAIWQTARLDPHREPSGWLGRALEQRADAVRQPLTALGIAGAGTSPVLVGTHAPYPSLSSLEAFAVQPDRRFPQDAPALNRALVALHASTHEDGMPAAYIRRVARTALGASAALASATQGYRSTIEYPKGAFGDQLRLVAQLCASPLGTTAFHLTLGGFDTHANQKRQQAGLLQQLSDGVAALLEDAEMHGFADRLAVLTYSEFGRRAQENASGGTDHGAGSIAFLAGAGVRGGLYGKMVDLGALSDGDVPATLDFRAIYASALQSWLGLRAAPVLGSTPPVSVFRA
ncbi:MAG: DUF1501 domain-containing protein [Myxococcaceae bacterium]